MIYVRERERGGGGSGLRLGTELAQTRRATACGGSCAGDSIECRGCRPLSLRSAARPEVGGAGRYTGATGERSLRVYVRRGVRLSCWRGKMERHEEAIISCAISRRAPPFSDRCENIHPVVEGVGTVVVSAPLAAHERRRHLDLCAPGFAR